MSHPRHRNGRTGNAESPLTGVQRGTPMETMAAQDDDAPERAAGPGPGHLYRRLRADQRPRRLRRDLHRFARGEQPYVGRGRRRQGSANAMELTAATHGLRGAPKGVRVVLISDSRYLIDNAEGALAEWALASFRDRHGTPVELATLWRDPHRGPSACSASAGAGPPGRASDAGAIAPSTARSTPRARAAVPAWWGDWSAIWSGI